MRHLTALPLAAGSGGWHYVSAGRKGAHPIGYCAEHGPHPTEDEARECYAQYMRDHVRLDCAYRDWSGCDVEGCDEPTKQGARIEHDAYRMALLCPAHLTVEDAVRVMHLDRPAGESWKS